MLLSMALDNWSCLRISLLKESRSKTTKVSLPRLTHNDALVLEGRQEGQGISQLETTFQPPLISFQY